MVREKLGRAEVQGGQVVVTITGGSAVIHDPSAPVRWRVANKQLVSVLQVLFSNRRLHVAARLKEAPTLVRELQTFKVKPTEAANESFEAWRQNLLGQRSNY
jgi:hypothetical protein